MAKPFYLREGYVTRPELIKIVQQQTPDASARNIQESAGKLESECYEYYNYTSRKKAYGPTFVELLKKRFADIPHTKAVTTKLLQVEGYVSVKELASRWKTRSKTVHSEIISREIGKGTDLVKEHKGELFVHESLVPEVRFHFVPDHRDVPDAKSVMGGKKKSLDDYDTYG